MGFYTILKRDLKNLIINPIMLIYCTVYPILIVLILGYLSSDNYNGKSVSSYDYFGVSIIIFFILFVGTISANSFMEKRVKTSNLRIMYSPIKLSYIYLSKMTAAFVFSSVCFLASMFLIKLILNVNYGGKNLIYVLIIFELFNLLSAAIGIFFCCIFKSEELANKILSPFLNVFGIFGGVFFPIDSLGKTAEKISYISPAKWVLIGTFKIIYDNDFSYFLPTVIILITLTVIFIIGCKLTFKEDDYV